MKQIEFWKYSGAGNDFVIFDLRNDELKYRLNGINRANLVARICPRAISVGADGVIFIENSEDSNVDFKWDFYNSDGSSADMCGNAARCVIDWYCKTNELKKNKIQFESKVGNVVGEFLNSEVEIELDFPNLIEGNKEINGIIGQFVNTGVPHFVVQVDDISNLAALAGLAQDLRLDEYFQPEGANITFFQTESESKIHSISYERGVNKFTLACGTGAIGSAFADLIQKEKLDIPLTVFVPGGELKVRFDKKNKKTFLKGPSKEVYRGLLNLEVLNENI